MTFAKGQMIGGLLIIASAVAIGIMFDWKLAVLIYLMFLGKNIEKL